MQIAALLGFDLAGGETIEPGSARVAPADAVTGAALSRAARVQFSELVPEPAEPDPTDANPAPLPDPVRDAGSDQVIPADDRPIGVAVLAAGSGPGAFAPETQPEPASGIPDRPRVQPLPMHAPAAARAAAAAVVRDGVVPVAATAPPVPTASVPMQTPVQADARQPAMGPAADPKIGSPDQRADRTPEPGAALTLPTSSAKKVSGSDALPLQVGAGSSDGGDGRGLAGAPPGSVASRASEGPVARAPATGLPGPSEDPRPGSTSAIRPDAPARSGGQGNPAKRPRVPTAPNQPNAMTGEGSGMVRRLAAKPPGREVPGPTLAAVHHVGQPDPDMGRGGLARPVGDAPGRGDRGVPMARVAVAGPDPAQPAARRLQPAGLPPAETVRSDAPPPARPEVPAGPGPASAPQAAPSATVTPAPPVSAPPQSPVVPAPVGVPATPAPQSPGMSGPAFKPASPGVAIEARGQARSHVPASTATSPAPAIHGQAGPDDQPRPAAPRRGRAAEAEPAAAGPAASGRTLPLSAPGMTHAVPAGGQTPGDERLDARPETTTDPSPSLSAPERAGHDGARPVSAHPRVAELPRPVAVQISQALHTGTGTVDLTLSPEELGRVSLSVSTQDGTITVTVTADRPETADLMRRHVNILVQEAHAEGFADVAFGFADQSGGNADPGASPPNAAPDDPGLREPEPRPAAAAARPRPGTAIDIRL